jgi:hypothetical protein
MTKFCKNESNGGVDNFLRLRRRIRGSEGGFSRRKECIGEDGILALKVVI